MNLKMRSSFAKAVCAPLALGALIAGAAVSAPHSPFVPAASAQEQTVKGICYKAFVQVDAWQGAVCDSATAGTTDQSKRLEEFRIDLVGGVPIQYRAHVQNIGWQDWKTNNQNAGTEGQSLRIEAIEAKLGPGADPNLHVEYRTYVQNIGWQDWKRDGQTAGTTGQSLRVEAIQMRLVKGDAVVGRDTDPNVAKVGFLSDTSWNGHSDQVIAGLASQTVDGYQLNGDLSMGDTTEANYSSELTSRLGSRPIEMAVGNHEGTNPTYYGKRHSTVGNYNLPDKMNAKPLMGKMDQAVYPWNYYYDLDGVRFIVTAPNIYYEGTTKVLSYNKGTDELAAFNATVKDAQSKGLWVVSVHHESFFDPGQHAGEVGNQGSKDLAQAEIDDNVDLVMAGHSHTYSRSNQVNGTITSNYSAHVTDSDGSFTEGKGTVFMIGGSGGDVPRNAKYPNQPAWAKTLGTDETRTPYGYGMVTADAHTLTGSFTATEGSKQGVYDTFTITR